MSSTHITIVEGGARLISSLPYPSNPLVSLLSLHLQLKLAVDFCGALTLLSLTSALFLLTSILIKLTSPGPVFFCQEWLGLYQGGFRIWKLRTMVKCSDNMAHQLQNEQKSVLFKPINDPRVTPVGRFLRKCSNDELPQLLNVLKGEISLVGPRPVLESELRRFCE
jgi:lipopolysaccharide/colanic/teichoic acid biosynthesis glycosyltransferase